MPIRTCALCRSEAELEVSHLLPRFVAKRQKADSPNPFLRSSRDPNRRIQDAPKEPLLCRSCEKRFSDFEKAFAQNIFIPTMDGVQLDDVVITRKQHKFCASIAWRHLVMVLRMHEVLPGDYTEEDSVSIERAAEALRRFLLGEAKLPTDLQCHLVCVRSTTETEYPGMNSLVNLTAGLALRRHEDTPERLYSIAFMNGLLLMTLIRSDEACRAQWIGGSTAVVPGGLWRNHRQEVHDPDFASVLIGIAQEHLDARATISDEQRAVISKSMAGIDFAKWASSPHGKAVVQDYLNARRTERRAGKNES